MSEKLEDVVDRILHARNIAEDEKKTWLRKVDGFVAEAKALASRLNNTRGDKLLLSVTSDHGAMATAIEMSLGDPYDCGESAGKRLVFVGAVLRCEIQAGGDVAVLFRPGRFPDEAPPTENILRVSPSKFSVRDVVLSFVKLAAEHDWPSESAKKLALEAANADNADWTSDDDD